MSGDGGPMAVASGGVNPACPRPPRGLAKQAMTKPDPKRAERLAEALRDNLRRRKAQAREGPTKDEANPAGD